ncbi:hypothetical protein G6F62_015479 [Rhizopus arrhizus]|nr:hypothetical protein G6F62_015479 [Rhizopus arrhizus]
MTGTIRTYDEGMKKDIHQRIARTAEMIAQSAGARADVRGDDGVHFDAPVVCAAFAGKMPLARHRMVYATLRDLMGGAIHALALKTVTPAEAG